MDKFYIAAGAVAIFVIFIGLGLIANRKRDDAWRQLASELGASFVKGSFRRSSMLMIPYKDWTVTLDTYSVPSGDSSTSYTRVSAPLQDMQGFWFALTKKGLVSKLDKALGTKEYPTGDAEFDKAFVIRGNDESKIKALFAHQSIRQLFQTERSLTAAIKKNVLSIEVTGSVKDPERLKTLFAMIKETLVQL
jgi:hypothetical protein